LLIPAVVTAVRCSKPVCPKEQIAVRRQAAPRVWAYGCNATAEHAAVHHCCVDKEICTRTCGMSWGRCQGLFDKCATKACEYDERCMLAAEVADALISGGGSHWDVCKKYRESQHDLCECVPLKSSKDGANERLKSFYAAYKPDKLDEDGNVQGAQEIWQRWRGREPELFLELTRKYSAEAVEFRARVGPIVGNALDVEDEQARQREEAEALARKRAEEELAYQLRRSQAEEELLRKDKEKELERFRAEEERATIREKVLQLRTDKAAAIFAEDYRRAKALKAQIKELDPHDEF